MDKGTQRRSGGTLCAHYTQTQTRTSDADDAALTRDVSAIAVLLSSFPPHTASHRRDVRTPFFWSRGVQKYTYVQS